MRRSCCAGFAAKPEQLPRSRIEHQSLRAPAQQAPRPDQRDDGDHAADHHRTPEHAADCGQTAIDAAELVLDLFRSRPQLGALHGDACQQVAVMSVELIETLTHCD